MQCPIPPHFLEPGSIAREGLEGQPPFWGRRAQVHKLYFGGPLFRHSSTEIKFMYVPCFCRRLAQNHRCINFISAPAARKTPASGQQKVYAPTLCSPWGQLLEPGLWGWLVWLMGGCLGWAGMGCALAAISVLAPPLSDEVRSMPNFLENWCPGAIVRDCFWSMPISRSI